MTPTKSYWLALCRYVERTPGAAALVARPGDWALSSCQAHLGQVPAPAWLNTLALFGHLLGRPAVTDADCEVAALHYAELVDGATPGDSSFRQRALRGQMFMGDETFARRMQARVMLERQSSAKGIPRVQRLLPSTWPECLAACEGDRNRAISMAYRQGGFTMSELASLTGPGPGLASCLHPLHQPSKTKPFSLRGGREHRTGPGHHRHRRRSD